MIGAIVARDISNEKTARVLAGSINELRSVVQLTLMEADMGSMLTRQRIRCALVRIAVVSLLTLAGGTLTTEDAAAAPYSERVMLACDEFSCSAMGERVPANRQLNIQFVSCFVEFPDASDVGLGFLGVDRAFESNKFRHSLDFRVHTFFSANIYVAAHPMVLAIPEGHRWAVTITTSGLSNAAECAVTGDLRVVP